jgi:hypothetical protein
MNVHTNAPAVAVIRERGRRAIRADDADPSLRIRCSAKFEILEMHFCVRNRFRTKIIFYFIILLVYYFKYELPIHASLSVLKR